MKAKSEYIIPFIGLKDGIHDYNFEIGVTFFESLECFDYSKVDVKVGLKLDKQSTMLVLHFDVKGDVVTDCDRCSDDVEVAIEGNYRVIARFTEEDYEETEEIINLPASEHEIDVTNFIYEFIRLSIPSKIVHEEGQCNEEMLEQLSKYLVSEEPKDPSEGANANEDEEIDPRWAALNKLKEK